MAWILSLFSFFSLFIKLFLHKSEELVHRNILKVSIVVANEPLVDLFEGILSALLVCNVIAVCRLLIELCERICCLFEAIFETIEVCIGSIIERLWDLLVLVTHLCIRSWVMGVHYVLGSSRSILVKVEVSRFHSNYFVDKFEVWWILEMGFFVFENLKTIILINDSLNIYINMQVIFPNQSFN